MVQQVAARRCLHCRMVRDSPDSKEVQSPKQEQAAEVQKLSPAPGESESLEPAASPEPVTANPETTNKELNLNWKHLLSRHISEEELESWCQPVRRGVRADTLPTHLRPFRSHTEYQLVKRTHQQLQNSSYYWGPMTMEEAHEILRHAPQGTFLIRDSGQAQVFFTLSYQGDDGPTSVRVLLKNLLFSLNGSHKTFASLFALLSYYTNASCKLTVPYRRHRPECLKQICRRALVRTHGADNLSTLSGLSTEMRDYVHEYPHCI